MYRSKYVCKHLLLRKLDILSSIRSVFIKKVSIVGKNKISFNFFSVISYGFTEDYITHITDHPTYDVYI